MKWTEEEVVFLKKNYGDMPTGDIAEELNRKRKSVYNKAQRLDLSQEYEQWTAEDEDFFRENWMDYTLKEFSEKLNHSVGALKQKARKMDLPKKSAQGPMKYWTDQEELYLYSHYPKDKIKTIAEDLDRTESSVAHKVKRLGLTKDWSQWEDEILRDFYGWQRMTAKELSETVLDHRSYYAIKHRAERSGLFYNSREKVTKICARCGQEFETSKSDADERKHCSRECNLKDRSTRSDIEIMMEKELEESGIDFQEQKICGPYSIDFVIGDVALEADGDYWHSEGVNHDKDSYLREHGYTPIHYWGSEIRDNVEGCITDCMNILGGI